MASRIVSIELTGSSAKAVRALKDVENQAEKTAKASTTSFTKSGTQVSNIFTKIGSAGSKAGLPIVSSFGNAASALSGASKEAGLLSGGLGGMVGPALAAAGGFAVLKQGIGE